MTIAQTGIIQNKKNSRRIAPLDITVLAGGPGVEREVSLQSGKAVNEALNRLGHRATLCDIHPKDLSALDTPVDFVFIALHGEFGEDGAIQKILDEKGIAYAGTGTRASQLAIDKVESKKCFERAGINTPFFVLVTHENLNCFIEKISPPVVVKPVCSGSSVDISIARTQDDMMSATQSLVAKHGSALVEQFIDGPELTVGILGDLALPVCEIRTRREFYDYQAKYVDDDTQYLFDLDLPATILKQVQEASVEAHNALGCRSFSRVDWMVDTSQLKPYILEINTIPGFTSHSLLPKAAARIGLNFDTLCNRIIELSLNTPKN